MTALQRRSPAGEGEASGMSASGRTFHVQSATAEPLLQRLERVQKAGNGWRARCPACGGTSAKLTVTESDGRVLLHCFGGCRAIDVLESVGLGWPDIMPPRTWPESPEERRRARQAQREAGAVAAIDVLAIEATVIRLAARQVSTWQPLSAADDDRLMLACDRIEKASHAMTRKDSWRPASSYAPPALVAVKRGAVDALERELGAAKVELEDAARGLEEFKRQQALKAAKGAHR